MALELGPRALTILIIAAIAVPAIYYFNSRSLLIERASRDQVKAATSKFDKPQGPLVAPPVETTTRTLSITVRPPLQSSALEPAPAVLPEQKKSLPPHSPIPAASAEPMSESAESGVYLYLRGEQVVLRLSVKRKMSQLEETQLSHAMTGICVGLSDSDCDDGSLILRVSNELLEALLKPEDNFDLRGYTLRAMSSSDPHQTLIYILTNEDVGLLIGDHVTLRKIRRSYPARGVASDEMIFQKAYVTHDR